MTYPPPSGDSGNQTAKCRPRVLKYLWGAGLDIGCGGEKVTPDAIGVDINPKDSDVVKADAVDLSMFGAGSMDYVFSSHCLEHIENDWQALREWWRVLKSGGYLVLYLPHRDVYPLTNNPDHKHRYVIEDIHFMLSRIEGKSMDIFQPVEAFDCYEGDYMEEFSFQVVFKKP